MAPKNLPFYQMIKLQFKYLKYKSVTLNCKNIICVFTVFWLNKALVSIRDFFQKHLNFWMVVYTLNLNDSYIL